MTLPKGNVVTLNVAFVGARDCDEPRLPLRVRDSVRLDVAEWKPLREKLMVGDTAGDVVRLSNPLQHSELEGAHIGDAVLVALPSTLMAPPNGNRSARSS